MLRSEKQQQRKQQQRKQQQRKQQQSAGNSVKEKSLLLRALGTNSVRARYEARIRALEEEAERSGKPHRRDLYRAIKRMKGELKEYDMYHGQSAKKKG